MKTKEYYHYYLQQKIQELVKKHSKRWNVDSHKYSGHTFEWKPETKIE